MSSNAVVTRKIAFQTMDIEVSLSETEYEYLKFICEATLRNSDEIVREQIRNLRAVGLPAFDEWRQQQPASVSIIPQTAALVPVTTAEVTTIDVGAEASEAPVEPRSRRKSATEPRSRRAKKSASEPDTTEIKAAENGAVAVTENGNAASTKTRSRRKSNAEATPARTRRTRKPTPASDSTLNAADSTASESAPETAISNGTPPKSRSRRNAASVSEPTTTRSRQGKPRSAKASKSAESDATATPTPTTPAPEATLTAESAPTQPSRRRSTGTRGGRTATPQSSSDSGAVAKTPARRGTRKKSSDNPGK